jgi:hypothetical protein
VAGVVASSRPSSLYEAEPLHSKRWTPAIRLGYGRGRHEVGPVVALAERLGESRLGRQDAQRLAVVLAPLRYGFDGLGNEALKGHADERRPRRSRCLDRKVARAAGGFTSHSAWGIRRLRASIETNQGVADTTRHHESRSCYALSGTKCRTYSRTSPTSMSSAAAASRTLTRASAPYITLRSNCDVSGTIPPGSALR